MRAVAGGQPLRAAAIQLARAILDAVEADAPAPVGAGLRLVKG